MLDVAPRQPQYLHRSIQAAPAPGAINAAIVASALAQGSPAQARKSLARVLVAVRGSGARRSRRRKIWGAGGTQLAPVVRRMAVIERCGDALQLRSVRHQSAARCDRAHVDIDAIRSKSSPALFVTVTNVKTGLRARHCQRCDVQIDALLASACVPELFTRQSSSTAKRYWDGSYCTATRRCGR